MKKLFFYMFLLIILMWLLGGCFKNQKATEELNLSFGIYEIKKSKEPIKPFISLKDRNKFTFTYSALSSYIAMGSYEVEEGNLILKTDDGKYKYVFKIRDNTLIFNSKESSKIPSFANVPNGAIFE